MKNSRFTFVSILGYGDALISLQLLQQASPLPAPLQIAGTGIAQEVQSTIIGSKFPLIEIVPDHAALFRLRKAGLRQSLHELLIFRKWAESALGPDDLVIFEKSDPRNHLILGRCNARTVAPKRMISSYVDRQRMLEGLTGRGLELPDCAQPKSAPRSVLINPSARAAERELSPAVMRNLLELFRRRGMRVSITDPDSRFAGAKEQFDRYYGRLKLPAVTALLREHDLYVGPDSFFIHLAYYLRVPFITLVPSTDFNFYFAPPGSMRLRNFIAMSQTHDQAQLAKAISTFVGW
jgi:hypothetical protein